MAAEANDAAVGVTLASAAGLPAALLASAFRYAHLGAGVANAAAVALVDDASPAVDAANAAAAGDVAVVIGPFEPDFAVALEPPAAVSPALPGSAVLEAAPASAFPVQALAARMGL